MPRRELLDPDVERELAALDAALAGERVDDDLRDLALLVADVREDAPRMRAEAAARLDERVAQGFAGAAAGAGTGRLARRFPRLSARPRWILVPAAGVAAAMLAAVVIVVNQGNDATPFSGEGAPLVQDGGGGGPGAGGPGADGEAAAPDATSEAGPEGRARDEAAAEPAPSAAAAPQSSVPPQPVPPPSEDLAPDQPVRRVERSALLVLEAPDGQVEAVADRVIRTTDRFGGIVRSSSIGAADESGGEATFDLRIPTARLDAALAALSRLGHVAQRSQDSLDITGSFASAQERLADARAERRGLLRALGRATTERQVQSLRARLRDATSRVARLKGDLGALRRRADLSTVSLTVRGAAGDSGTGDAGPWTPRDAAGDAVRLLEVAAGVLLVALAAAVPLALLGAPALIAARAARRRRREAALDPA